jgi:hypothetical protein
MSVISKIKDAILKKDWSLIIDVLEDISGEKIKNEPSTVQQVVQKESVVLKNADENLNKFAMSTNNTLANKKEQVSKIPFENKFQDDKTLDSEFIEETPKNYSPKKYRSEVDDSYGFKLVKCSKCSSSLEITTEEFNFKSRDSESSGFICASCMKRSVRR